MVGTRRCSNWNWLDDGANKIEGLAQEVVAYDCTVSDRRALIQGPLKRTWVESLA